VSESPDGDTAFRKGVKPKCFEGPTASLKKKECQPQPYGDGQALAKLSKSTGFTATKVRFQSPCWQAAPGAEHPPTTLMKQALS